MDKKENAYLEMANRTVLFCNNNARAWQNNQVITKVLNTIKDMVTTGNNLQKEKTGANYTGLTGTKDQKFDEMTKQGLKLAKKMAAFARIEGITEILPLVDYSHSSLTEVPEKEVMRRCMVISEKARLYMDRLTDYKVTVADADALDTVISTYKNLPEERNNAKSSKKVIGQDLTKTIKAIREQFIILDDLVEGLIDNDNFENKYFEARMIIDPASGRSNGEADTE